MPDNLFSTFDITIKKELPTPELIEALERKGFTHLHPESPKGSYSFKHDPISFADYSALLEDVANETQISFRCYSSVPVGENKKGDTAVLFEKNDTMFYPDKEDGKEFLRSN